MDVLLRELVALLTFDRSESLSVAVGVLCLFSAAALGCPSNEFNGAGECCDQCPPGFGVIQSCSQTTNTLCDACEPGRTFSPVLSHTEFCKRCSPCPPDMRVVYPCNGTHDTVCECKENFYYSHDTESCSQCDVCPPGFGAVLACAPHQNTQCQPCRRGTYSDTTSTKKSCQICSTCQPNEEIVEGMGQCTNITDTICVSTKIVIMPSPEIPQVSSQSRTDNDEWLVPMYCTLLSLLVVGLFCYASYRKYQAWKVSNAKKKSTQIGFQGSFHELHKPACGDSGIFTNAEVTSNNENVPEHLHHSTPLMALSSTMLYSEVCKERRQEFEWRLSITRADGCDWRGLACQLGFDQEDIRQFACQASRAYVATVMLNSWSRQPRVTLGQLVGALQRIGRLDLLRIIPVYINLSSAPSL